MLLALVPLAVAQQYFGENGYAEFESRAPALTFTGTSENLAGLIDLNVRTVDFFLDLNTLDTGISLRNRHMRDSYLRTSRFPFAEFRGRFADDVEVDLLNESPQKVQVQGTFTIHGITRERTVEGTLTFEDGGAVVFLEALFEVALEDHNISRPRVIFYELSDIQRVTIRIQMEKYND
jgi:polyisoprenoid-binding protein YceI